MNDQEKKTILIIEDDQFLLEIYKVKLQDANYIVECLEDGVQCVEKAEEFQPSLILLDLILPTKSGFDVLTELKENPKTKDIPVLILSNLGAKNDIERGIKGGAEAYFVKAEISAQDIVDKVKQYAK